MEKREAKIIMEDCIVVMDEIMKQTTLLHDLSEELSELPEEEMLKEAETLSKVISKTLEMVTLQRKYTIERMV